MEIIKQYGDFTKQELFNLSQGNTQLLKSVPDGTMINIDRMVILRVESGDGKEKEIMHIQTVDGNIYSTESPTVQTTINMAINFMETHKLTFELYRSTSKAGRQFMNVRLV